MNITWNFKIHYSLCLMHGRHDRTATTMDMTVERQFYMIFNKKKKFMNNPMADKHKKCRKSHRLSFSFEELDCLFEEICH